MVTSASSCWSSSGKHSARLRCLADMSCERELTAPNKRRYSVATRVCAELCFATYDMANRGSVWLPEHRVQCYSVSSDAYSLPTAAVENSSGSGVSIRPKQLCRTAQDSRGSWLCTKSPRRAYTRSESSGSGSTAVRQLDARAVAREQVVRPSVSVCACDLHIMMALAVKSASEACVTAAYPLHSHVLSRVRDPTQRRSRPVCVPTSQRLCASYSTA